MGDLSFCHGHPPPSNGGRPQQITTGRMGLATAVASWIRRRRPITTSSLSSSSTSSRPLLRSPTWQDVRAFKDLLQQGTRPDRVVYHGHFSVDQENDPAVSRDQSPGAEVLCSSSPTAVDLLAVHNRDWTGHWPGPGQILLQPETPAQVAALLRYCQTEGLGVVPQGGRTGLVGGAVPRSTAEIMLSTARLQGPSGQPPPRVDPWTGVVAAPAGSTLLHMRECVQAQGWWWPWDVGGAQGSCCLGGNVATQAGGIFVGRYGPLAAHVVGLQVAMASGQLVHWNYPYHESKVEEPPAKEEEEEEEPRPIRPIDASPLLKDNTGYKLHQLLLGSEGTLGIVTGVAVRCRPWPTSRQTAWLACPSWTAVLETWQAARLYLGEILAALEWMDQPVMSAVVVPGLPDSSFIPRRGASSSSSSSSSSDDGFYGHYLLVETHGSHAGHDQEKMERFFRAVLEEKACVADGVMAQDEGQREAFWRIREAANPTVGRLGYTYKYDVSLPIPQFEDFGLAMKQHVVTSAYPGRVDFFSWGHVMDGNLHFNVTTPGLTESHPDVLRQLEPALFHAVLRRGGSISAEHGVGQAKSQYLPLVHDRTTLDLMRQIKNVWDPVGILNPGKLLPPDTDY